MSQGSSCSYDLPGWLLSRKGRVIYPIIQPGKDIVPILDFPSQAGSIWPVSIWWYSWVKMPRCSRPVALHILSSFLRS